MFTKNKKYKNIFTVDYFDKYFNYYIKKFDGENIYTFVQTIDLTTTDDTVTILIFHELGGRFVKADFSPLESPYKIYCPATNELPQTFVGKTVKVDCPFGGNKEYKCEKDGVWENKVNSCTYKNINIIIILIIIVVIVVIIIIIILIRRNHKVKKELTNFN